jgi:hypothetical protein
MNTLGHYHNYFLQPGQAVRAIVQSIFLRCLWVNFANAKHGLILLLSFPAGVTGSAGGQRSKRERQGRVQRRPVLGQSGQPRDNRDPASRLDFEPGQRDETT